MDEWFLSGVRVAVWGRDPLKIGDLWDSGERPLSFEEKKTQLKELMAKWPKPQP